MSKKAMESFQELVFKLAETRPNAPLTSAAKTHVRNRLNRFFYQYQVPDHPPYSAMIERALRESNDEGGSSEASISHFIQEKYSGLPWTHPTLLKHHLQKQCEYGCLVPTLSNKYMLVSPNPNSESERNCDNRENSVITNPMQEICPFERPTTPERCCGYDLQIVDINNVFFSEVDWANEYQESDHIVIEDVPMSLEQLEELPMGDLFELINQIDNSNPSQINPVEGLFNVPKDGKFSESLQSENQGELMLQSTEDIVLQSEATQVPPKSKRRRGRPRKQKSGLEDFMNRSRQDSEQKERTQKRRRGRPPLDKMKSADVELDKYNQDRPKGRGASNSGKTPANTFRLNIHDLIY